MSIKELLNRQDSPVQLVHFPINWHIAMSDQGIKGLFDDRHALVCSNCML
jgi:hypothetical protein